MTRTDPPNILESTVYQAVKVSSFSTHTKSCYSSKQCYSAYIQTPKDTQNNKKRHCHIFNTEIPDKSCLECLSPPTWARIPPRARSRSAPRVQTNLTPVRTDSSPPVARRGREVHRSRHPQWRPEGSPRRASSHAITRALVNEVHPIKLQPQKTDTSRYSPVYVTESLDEGGPDKLAISPHVRCRMDIKPDETALQQHVQKPSTPKVDIPWQRYHSSSSRSLTVPRHSCMSKTTPSTEFFTDEYRPAYQYSQSMPNTPARTYYQDECFSIPNTYKYPAPVYPKSYAANEPGPYIIQTPPARTFYSDDPRTYQIQAVPPTIFYMGDPYVPPLEHHIPARANYTEGRHRAHVVQPPSDDCYSSDVSGYSTHYPSSYTSQVTPTRVKEEPVLTPWYTNPCMESTKAVTDPRPYSRSWDNILNTHVEREQPVSRGKSDENILCQGKQAFSAKDRPKPVVVNLSSSPRRYAALSLSENSLTDKSPTDARSTSSKQWFITPEITITDNDIKSSKGSKTEARSASWDVLDSKSSRDEDCSHQETMAWGSVKEKTHQSVSLKQSLEQLDELLADLVIDYKPPASRKPSEDLLDQLRKLIDEEEAASSRRKDSKADSESSMPLDKQPTSIKIDPETEGSFDGLRSTDECSPDQSPDEDDTMICSNNKCRRTETLFNACLYFKSCHSCYTYYCSRNCRREDWDVHKESCLYGRMGSVCRHIIKYCRETGEVHKAFSRIAKVGYLSRGRGVLFLGFPNPGSSTNFLQFGLESLLMSPTYLSLRELDGFRDNLGEYCKELQEAGKEYDPNECFLLNVSIAVGEQVPDGPSPRVQAPTVRKYAKVALASYSPERKVHSKESDMETLILTPPPGTADIDKDGEEGRKAREICFINIQRELRIRGVFLRHEYPQVYQKLCEFVESNRRFTPTTIYPIDKRTGKQFMCMIMAASEPRTLDWVATPHLLDDII
uniref:Apical junction molecule ajm1 alpha/beta domain-containing protein n=1 Tax=Electrophorus electricus TaxID=8005 RepID=A0A4W4FSS1_ELEEL